MAKTLFKWAGSTVTLTIGNKAANNSGITGAYLNAFVGGDSDGLGGVSLIDGNTFIENFTNSNSGNPAASVGTAKLLDVKEGNVLAGSNGYLVPITAEVNWQGGGVSHAITPSTSYFHVLVPATHITVGHAAEMWSNSLGTVNSYFSSSYAIPTNSSAKYNISFDTLLNNGVNIVAENDLSLALKSNQTINGSAKVNYQAQSITGDITKSDGTLNTDIAAPTEIQASGSFTVKNAVTAIKVNGSTSASNFYITKDETKEIPYTVVPHLSGKAYSYSVSIATATDSAVATTGSIVTASQSADGKIPVTGKKVGKTTFTLKSTASKSAVTSPVVTIYVSAAATVIYLNCSDSYRMEVNEAAYFELDDKATNAGITASIAESGGVRTLIITAGNKEVTGAVVTLKANNVSISSVTVNVSHVTVDLA